MYILLVDDDLSLATVLAEYMRGREMRVDIALDGEEALQRLRTTQYDLCLLDINMPGKNGFAVLQTLRKEQNRVPVFMLSGRNSREDILRAYKLGCDDYVTKPFSMEILVCKIEALMNRLHGMQESKETRFELGTCVFDAKRQTLGGERLTARESDVLLLLCRHLNEVVDRHVLLQKVWKADNAFAARSLAVFAYRLRQRLAPTGYTISPARGRRYRLVSPDME